MSDDIELKPYTVAFTEEEIGVVIDVLEEKIKRTKRNVEQCRDCTTNHRKNTEKLQKLEEVHQLIYESTW